MVPRIGVLNMKLFIFYNDDYVLFIVLLQLESLKELDFVKVVLLLVKIIAPFL